MTNRIMEALELAWSVFCEMTLFIVLLAVCLSSVAIIFWVVEMALGMTV